MFLTGELFITCEIDNFLEVEYYKEFCNIKNMEQCLLTTFEIWKLLKENLKFIVMISKKLKLTVLLLQRLNIWKFNLALVKVILKFKLTTFWYVIKIICNHKNTKFAGTFVLWQKIKWLFFFCTDSSFKVKVTN